MPDRHEENVSGGDVLALLQKVLDQQAVMLDRLDKLEQRQGLAVVKEWYTTDEVSERLKKKSPWTVREWCRQGQVPEAKKVRGRGRTGEWMISHKGLLRLQNEGPLPRKSAA